MILLVIAGVLVNEVVAKVRKTVFKKKIKKIKTKIMLCDRSI